MALTTPQFLDGSKDVTRRDGWANLKAGEHLMAVEKGQGLKKGEKVKRLGEIEVLQSEREPLHAICDHPGDCAREGFPEMTPMEFIEMYCRHNGGTPKKVITRIVFRRV
jgi:hypothetical protein